MFSSQYEKKLKQFIHENDAYNKHLQISKSQMAAPMAAPKGPSASIDEELGTYYRFDKTGNILVSTTGSDANVGTDLKIVFQKLMVFLAAWTKALKRKGLDLFDYDALNDMISSSGFFIKLHKEERTISQVKSNVTLDSEIILSALGAVINPEAATFAIAKKILSGLGDKIKASLQTNSKSDKIAHLLFVCEDLLGMAVVNVSLFYIEKDQWEAATSSNCHEQVSSAVNFKYNQETYMFVDPDFMRNNADSLNEGNKDYEELVDKLSRSINPRI